MSKNVVSPYSTFWRGQRPLYTEYTFDPFDMSKMSNIALYTAVADPGFPRGGGANCPGGCQHTILPNFPKNCMKLKEFGPLGGGTCPSHPPLDPTTVQCCVKATNTTFDPFNMSNMSNN